MKVKKFTVPLFNFDVTVIEVAEDDNIEKVLKACKLKGTKFHSEIKENLESGYYDGAQFIYNMKAGRGLILIYHHKTKNGRLVSLGHEKRHLEDKILEYHGIEDYESAAMLAGYLTEKLL